MRYSEEHNMNSSYIGLAETNYDASTKIWSGKKRKDFFGPDVTLGEATHFILSLIPEKIVQVMDPTGEQLNAGQLLRNSKLIAKNLLQLGLKPGDVVGIAASNTTYMSSVVLSAFLCGMPTNALYPDFDKESVEVIFRITKPKVLFCDIENCAVIKEAAKALDLNAEIFVLNGELEAVRCIKELLVDDGRHIDFDSLPCRHMTGNDAAVIVCSSGTTGAPKRVICSHKALLNQTVVSNLQSDSVLLTFSTFFWVSGVWLLIAALLSGTKRVITNKPFTVEYFEELVEKYRITHTISAPHEMVQLVQKATPKTGQRLQSISCILCGGTKVPKIVMQKFNEIFGTRLQGSGLTEAYGLSELASVLSENDAGAGKRCEGSAGKLMPNMEAQIVEQNTGQLMGVNSIGIIQIRTPYKWAGYYNNPEATVKANNNGWLYTNDIGYFDDDGFLHIMARESDVFKSSGLYVHPPKIEDVVLELPGVLEACIFGVPDLIANRLTACAVVRAKNEHGRRITGQQIEQHVAKKMADRNHIKAGVFFVEALPKTPSGKVQRNKVIDMIKLI